MSKPNLESRVLGLESRRGKGIPPPFGDPRVWKLRLEDSGGNLLDSLYFWQDDLSYVLTSYQRDLTLFEASGLQVYWDRSQHALKLAWELSPHSVEGKITEIDGQIAALAPVVSEELRRRETRDRRHVAGGTQPCPP